eukprot:m.262486 g.262486  ORF g.262486 m.262486 type:complete len:71 (-) comp22761_c1_seq5:330-542(-)
MEAIHHQPNSPQAYRNLGKQLKDGEKVLLKDQRMLSKRDLYMEAIHYHPNNFSAFCNLARELPPPARAWC